MLFILQESLKGYNLPFTVLLGFVCIYWLVAVFGLVDIEGGGDVDLDMDVDGDLDLDTDAGSAENAGGTEFIHTAFKVIGITDAPIILILSILSLILWGLNIIANLAFNTGETIAKASLLVVPVLIIAVIFTRLLIRPLRPVMKILRAKEKPAQTIGKEGKVISATINHEFGRVEIDFDGKPLLLNAILSEDNEALKKGATVLIVSKNDETDTYIVRPL